MAAYIGALLKAAGGKLGIIGHACIASVGHLSAMVGEGVAVQSRGEEFSVVVKVSDGASKGDTRLVWIWGFVRSGSDPALPA